MTGFTPVANDMPPNRRRTKIRWHSFMTVQGHLLGLSCHEIVPDNSLLHTNPIPRSHFRIARLST